MRCSQAAGPPSSPLCVAAAEAALEPGFNAHGIAVTTQPAGPILVVNGPVRETLGINSGMGALGPGTRANMTIGRALRLCSRSRAAPGRVVSTAPRWGMPGKLGTCFAENEETSPWEPLHVERGFLRDASTVTLFAGDAPLSISDHRSRTPEELARRWRGRRPASGARSGGRWTTPRCMCVCPEHAMLFAAAGWSKDRVRAAMFDAVQRPAGELRRGETTPFVQGSADDALVRKWT